MADYPESNEQAAQSHEEAAGELSQVGHLRRSRSHVALRSGPLNFSVPAGDGGTLSRLCGGAGDDLPRRAA
jgi:hypothetical protein